MDSTREVQEKYASKRTFVAIDCNPLFGEGAFGIRAEPSEVLSLLLCYVHGADALRLGSWPARRAEQEGVSVRTARRFFREKRIRGYTGIDESATYLYESIRALLTVANVEALPSVVTSPFGRDIGAELQISPRAKTKPNEDADVHQTWETLKISDEVGVLVRERLLKFRSIAGIRWPHFASFWEEAVPPSATEAATRLKGTLESILISLSHSILEGDRTTIALIENEKFTGAMEMEFSSRVRLLPSDLADVLAALARDLMSKLHHSPRIVARWGSIELLGRKALFRPSDTLDKAIADDIEAVFKDE